MSVSNLSRTETLDPRDWGAMQNLARRMVDDAFEYLGTVRERPAWQDVPAAVAQIKSSMTKLFMIGLSCGSVIKRNRCRPFAPSIFGSLVEAGGDALQSG